MLRHAPATTLALSLALSLSPVSSFSGAANESLSFKVAFSNCEEFVGEGPVALAPAQRLVPQGYAITVTPSGQAPIVVHMTQCQAVKVDGARAVPTTISQIGVNIVSPDGTGTINSYTLVYVTNNPFLAEALDRTGIPATYDPAIVYEYTHDSAGLGGMLYGAVPDARVPAYFLHGPETEPPANAQRLFVANWWHSGGELPRVRQQTTFPAISFGAANVVLYTSRFSALGQLIGGNTYDSFSLAWRGVYASAEMIVSDFAQ
jgi:hypothetical protein